MFDKTNRCIASAASLIAALCLVGCGQNQNSQQQAGSGNTVTPVPAQPEDQPRSYAPSARAGNAEVPSGDVAQAAPTVVQAAAPATVKLMGRDFISQQFPKENIVAPGVLGLKHFGEVQKEFSLEKDYRKARLVLGTGSTDGSAPKVQVRIQTTSGRYRDWLLLNKEPIRAMTETTTETVFPRGNYRVKIGYFESDPPNKRPALHVHSLTFE